MAISQINTNSIASGAVSAGDLADSSVTAAKLASGAAASNLGNYVSTVNGSTGAVTVQATLVSGTNIKTINSTSLLGSGDITVGASTSLNGIGTYVFGAYQSNGGDTRNPGATYATGTSQNTLRLGGGYVPDGNDAMQGRNTNPSGYISGTWRSMNASFSGGNTNDFWFGVFVRVS